MGLAEGPLYTLEYRTIKEVQPVSFVTPPLKSRSCTLASVDNYIFISW